MMMMMMMMIIIIIIITLGKKNYFNFVRTFIEVIGSGLRTFNITTYKPCALQFGLQLSYSVILAGFVIDKPFNLYPHEALYCIQF